MMKNTIAILCALLLPYWAAADEDDKAETSTVEIQGGKIIGEKHEIDIYDYHTGTYNTVDVYRKPDKAVKKQPEALTQPQSVGQTPR